MKLEQVKQLIEENQTNEEWQTYLQGLNPYSVEGIERYIQSNKEAKSWFDSTVDKRSAKSLETWKANHLESAVDAEIKKRFPAKDEKDIEVEKLRTEVENMKLEKQRERLTSQAIKIASEKKLPLPLVDFFIDADEEATTANLAVLEQSLQGAIQQQVEQRLKGDGYTPPANSTGRTFTLDSIKGMSPTEINQHWDQVKQALQNKQ
ncbi:macrodomain Ter protein organizer (MatP/YcbG family) [Paenibacillus jamilae]|nr:macrodomain Ter protein organizer (MatP/YcbG family) [Paenibacillus jamilae]